MKNLNIIVRQDTFLLKIALLMFFSMAAGQISGQNGIPNGSCGIEYTYDAVGNMVKREYLCNNSGRMMSPAPTMISNFARDGKSEGIHEVQTLFQKIDIVYPNPATGKFSIRMVIPLQNAGVEIVNAQGMAILRQNVSGSLLEFNLSGRPSGTYFIKIYHNTKVFSTRVIIQ